MSSRLHRNWATANDLEVGPTLGISPDHRASHLLHVGGQRPSSPTSIAREKSEERFDRAKDELRRRLGVERAVAHERSNPTTLQRPLSFVGQEACPPSPDDEIAFSQQASQEYWNRNDQSSENSPVGGSGRGLALSSSEDQFSAMSQSESNPSIPSVASAGSPAQDGCASYDDHSWIPPTSASSYPVSEFPTPVDDAAGYDGDHAIESDEEDSDEDELLMMGTIRKKPRPANRSNSISNAELARANVHAGFARRRSTRSGSNGTVKKVSPSKLSPEQTSTPESTQ